MQEGQSDGATKCDASGNYKVYIYTVGADPDEMTPDKCKSDCMRIGYSFGKIESCQGSVSCVCHKPIDCCSNSDCPSGSKCVNNFCVKDSECGKKNTPCCSSEPNNCVDYQGNEVHDGNCGYPTQEAANDGHPWYCDNGKWVQTICTCLTDLYSSCKSLGFSGSCGSCSGTCADPPGSTVAMKFCYSDLYSSPQGPSQECNSGLNCCGDNYCHECCSDSDCSGYDPDTHTKIVCDCPDSGCSLTGSSYSCKALPSCSDNSHCDPNYCCDFLVGGEGSCKPEGTIINYGGKSYLCDPPYGFATGESEINNPIKEQKVEVTNLIDMIFRIFSRIRIFS